MNYHVSVVSENCTRDSPALSHSVLVFMAFPLTWAADNGFRAFSACVIRVVPLWVMHTGTGGTTLFFTVPLLRLCGTVTPSCLLVLLGLFGISFGTLTCVRLSPLSRMHSRLMLIYVGCGDLAAATSVAAPPPYPPPFPFSFVPFCVSYSFGHLLWPVFHSFGLCVCCGHLSRP
eukprot:jgi/Botrbrau1/823/Bobra.0352s0020.1